MTMGWKSLLRLISKPRQYIKRRCPICHEPLESFPGSAIQMCRNDHKFGEGMKRVDLINDGDTHGEI